MILRAAQDNDFSGLLKIWERAVRATHHFLPENELQSIKSQLIPVYFPHVQLTVAVGEQGNLLGFSGVAEKKLEMLFVDPAYHRGGIGKALLQFSVSDMAVNEVDVNEQNPAAVQFYLSQGFEQVARSAVDGQGNPFPILHLMQPRIDSADLE